MEGLARGDSETWGEAGEASMVEAHSGDAYIRLALGPSNIAGAIVMGDQALSFALQELVEARADIGSIAAGLRAPGAPVSELIGTFWRDWKANRA